MPPILEAVQLKTKELAKLDVQPSVTDHASVEGNDLLKVVSPISFLIFQYYYVLYF